MPRATKGEIREVLQQIGFEISTLKQAVTNDDGAEASSTIEAIEERVDELRGLLENRYEDAFPEEVGEGAEEEEEEEDEEEPEGET